ncbi:kelch repeat-containing protein [Amycolatopsis sp. cmx-4-68]|uniref:kelch repeat-containing protein n=1 Tax=Amycolatopsis sp. cmx-4-68 TaxID=2790938 RepID=UPI003978A0B8
MAAPTVTPVGTWQPAGDLPTPVAWYGQHDGPVLLANGDVVVAGGADAGGFSVPDTAVFDTGHGQWHAAAGVLHAPRRLHTLTRLANGKVLAVGGLNGSTGLSSAELFDPGTGRWTDAGSLVTPRWGHSATLLADGSVLVTGGSADRPGGGVTALRSAERFDPDPEHGGWHPARAMTDARTAHTAIRLESGLVLVVGGVAPVGAADDPALAFCELYDPDQDTWTTTGSLRHGRRHHRATLLSGGAVVVTGGTAPGSPGTAPFDPFSQRTVERFDPATGTWTEKAPMPSGRAFHRAVALPDDQLLVVGGAASDRDESGFRSALFYDAGEDEWAPLPGLRDGRWSFAALALAGGGVLVAGGVARSGLAAADPGTTELVPTTEVFGKTA